MLVTAVVNVGGQVRVEELDVLPGAGAESPVEVELIAADVQPKDRQTARGEVRIPLPPRFVCGSNAIGRRVDTGEMVGVRGIIGAAGGLRDGVYATRFIAEESWLIPLPTGLDPVVAAAGFAGMCDAIYALDDLAGLRRGESVLTLGSSSGVSAAAADLALARGHAVVAATRTPERMSPREGLHVVGYDSLPEQVRSLVGGANVVIDSVGGAITPLGLRATARRGRQVVLGYLAGREVPLNVIDLIPTEASLIGMNASVVPLDRAREIAAEALEALASGAHVPTGIHVRPLEEGAAALVDESTGGRTVLVP